METELLRTFTAVVRSGSFTAAARELGYVQSTVTGHLQALERRLGARLLDRLPSGAIPTEAGARLLPYAEQLLALETRLADEVPDRDRRPAGRVRLVAPESLCAYRLPALLPGLRTAAPEIRLALAPAGTAAALAAVRAGTAEVALLLEPALTAPDLLLEPLGVEELVLLTAPTGGPTGQAVTWAQLADQDVLLLEDGCSYSDDTARRLLAAGQPDSRRTRFGSIEAVKRCAAAGLGWTVLPAITAKAELGSGTLTALPGPLATRTHRPPRHPPGTHTQHRHPPRSRPPPHPLETRAVERSSGETAGCLARDAARDDLVRWAAPAARRAPALIEESDQCATSRCRRSRHRRRLQRRCRRRSAGRGGGDGSCRWTLTGAH